MHLIYYMGKWFSIDSRLVESNEGTKGKDSKIQVWIFDQTNNT